MSGTRWARWIGALIVGLALLAPAASSRADHGWHGGHGGWHGGWHGGGGWHGPRVRVFVGPGWGWGPGWGYWGPPYAYGPTVYQAPPADPPEYIERDQPAGYWYYCESAGDYYPRVSSCAEPWVKVPPTPEQ